LINGFVPTHLHHPGMLSRLVIAATVLATAGCSSLLPRGGAKTTSPFDSYAHAQAAAERIVPFRSTTADLAAAGFDPDNAANVTVIPYPEILGRLTPYSGVPMERLDRGIRACIDAQVACRGYLFRFQQESRQREGSFFADFLNIHRVTHTTGWAFEAMVVVSDGVVLFRNTGGEPRVERYDRQTNPLGPLQPAGEAAGALIVR
jgi:hypothetical protein